MKLLCYSIYFNVTSGTTRTKYFGKILFNFYFKVIETYIKNKDSFQLMSPVLSKYRAIIICLRSGLSIIKKFPNKSLYFKTNLNVFLNHKTIIPRIDYVSMFFNNDYRTFRYFIKYTSNFQ